MTMTYTDDILTKLQDPNNWPGFERPDFLNELDELADDSFEKNTVDGYLASVMLYHQLVEEFIRILIESSTFYIQLSVFPQEYRERDIKGKMFGSLLKELRQSVIDDEIKKLIEDSGKLNELRNKIVHKLTKIDTIEKIKELCKEVQSLYNELWELFDDINDKYKVTFKDYLKDIDELKERLE